MRTTRLSETKIGIALWSLCGCRKNFRPICILVVWNPVDWMLNLPAGRLTAFRFCEP